MLKVLSLFAGIGGFDLGLERTGGFKTVAVAETDPYASKVLAKRFPDAPNVGDVTIAEYPNADIICAGFPCQDISFAGAGAGLAGSRSGLWREVVRAIRLVRPRGVLLENVAALLGRGLDTVLGDLAAIGHDAEWHCIPAAAIGAPHIRDRIWIYAEPQHSDANRLGSHRAEEYVEGDAEPAHQQVRLVGQMGALLADTNGVRVRGGRHGRASSSAGENGGEARKQRLRPNTQPGRQDVANANRAGSQGRDGEELPERPGERPAGSPSPCGIGGFWSVEPDVGRVAHGIPKRVDRLRCLGNAVVPQIPELIGRAILSAIADRSPEGGDHEDGRHAKHESAVGNADAPGLQSDSHSGAQPMNHVRSGVGASRSATGLSQAEPEEVSALRASIPSAEAFHPSEIIQDELNARGWDKFDLVARMGGDPARTLLALDVYFIVGPTHPSCRIGDTIAHQLAVALDVSAQYFLNLEAAWLDHPSTKALASAIEARRAAAGNTDAVHESATVATSDGDAKKRSGNQ